MPPGTCTPAWIGLSALSCYHPPGQPPGMVPLPSFIPGVAAAEAVVREGTDQVADLHRRASTWFEEHGLLDEALHHALAAGDLDLAARQMSAGLRDVLNREDRPTLERWLRLLPQEVIQQRPELLMIRAWVLQFLWRFDQQAKVSSRWKSCWIRVGEHVAGE